MRPKSIGRDVVRPRRGADTDAEGNRKNLLHMIALNERLPDLIIVPAHDMRAFAPLPKLSEATSELGH